MHRAGRRDRSRRGAACRRRGRRPANRRLAGGRRASGARSRAARPARRRGRRCRGRSHARRRAASAALPEPSSSPGAPARPSGRRPPSASPTSRSAGASTSTNDCSSDGRASAWSTSRASAMMSLAEAAATIAERSFAGRHRNCLAAPEQRRRLADAVALFDAAPSATRRARRRPRNSGAGRPPSARAKHAVALLPLPDRVGWHAGALRQRGDVEARTQRQLLDESVPERVTVGKRARGRHPPPGGKPAPGARR